MEGAGLAAVNHKTDVAVLLGDEEAADAVGDAEAEGDQPAAVQGPDEVPPLGCAEAQAGVPERLDLRNLAGIHKPVDVRGGPVDGAPPVVQQVASLGWKTRSKRSGVHRAAQDRELGGVVGHQAGALRGIQVLALDQVEIGLLSGNRRPRTMATDSTMKPLKDVTLRP